MNAPDDDEGSVALFVRRRVRAGCEAAYEQRLQALMEHTRHLPGYLGGNTERPHAVASSAGATEYTSVIRFDSVAHLHAFEHSPARQAFTAEVAAMVASAPEVRQLSGLETWFVPPPGAPAAQPVRWRMALVLLVVVYALITSMSALVGPWLGALPPPMRMLVVVALQVVLMTYLVMPHLTRVLAPWLFPRPGRPVDAGRSPAP